MDVTGSDVSKTKEGVSGRSWPWSDKQEEFQAVGTIDHRPQVHTVFRSQLQNQKALGPALEPR